jgi:hypothetical protein
VTRVTLLFNRPFKLRSRDRKPCGRYIRTVANGIAADLAAFGRDRCPQARDRIRVQTQSGPPDEGCGEEDA